MEEFEVTKGLRNLTGQWGFKQSIFYNKMPVPDGPRP